MINFEFRPKENESTKHAGKYLSTVSASDGGGFDYKVELPREMNRQEFVEWFVTENGWHKVKDELGDSDWKEFSKVVDGWDKKIHS